MGTLEGSTNGLLQELAIDREFRKGIKWTNDLKSYFVRIYANYNRTLNYVPIIKSTMLHCKYGVISEIINILHYRTSSA